MFSIIEWHFLISERFLKNSCNYITEFNISIRSYIYVVKHNRFSIFAAYPRFKKFIFTGALSNNRKSGRQNIHVFVFKSSLCQHAICCWDWLKKHSFLLPREIDCILKMRQIRDSNASSERKRIWRKDPAKPRKLIWQRLVPTMSANCGRSSNLYVRRRVHSVLRRWRRRWRWWRCRHRRNAKIVGSGKLSGAFGQTDRRGGDATRRERGAAEGRGRSCAPRHAREWGKGYVVALGIRFGSGGASRNGPRWRDSRSVEPPRSSRSSSFVSSARIILPACLARRVANFALSSWHRRCEVRCGRCRS